MKRVFIIHGWDGKPEHGWTLWLKKELEQKGYIVEAPAMPDTATPTLEKWLQHLAKTVGTPDKDCYFVGHSLGCITILRYFELLKENQTVGGAVFVAGFSTNLEYEGYQNELLSFFKTPILWEKIKNHCKKFVAIHSTDDPWVLIKHLDIFKEKLDADAVRMENMQHFSGDDGVTELPILLEKVLEISN